MDIVEELRAVARVAAIEIDPRCAYACSTARAADEIERLRRVPMKRLEAFTDLRWWFGVMFGVGMTLLVQRFIGR